MSYDNRRCDKCQFWKRFEEADIGECKIHNPIPHTTLDEDGKTLIIQALWPTPEAHEFCWEFVAEEEEQAKEKFSQDKFIEWMNEWLTKDYVLDLYPNESGLGISGKISSSGKDISRTKATEKIDILVYLERFFAPEDIDVSFS